MAFRDTSLRVVSFLLSFACLCDCYVWFRTPTPWSWICENNRCVKHDTANVTETQTLQTCKLICGTFSSLWPYPTGKVELGKTVLPVLPQNIIITKATGPSNEVVSMLQEATRIFNETIKSSHPDYKRLGDKVFEENHNSLLLSIKVKIELVVVSGEKRITSTTDENYTLGLQTVGEDVSVVILANTFFGARHGLETLSQLIAYDELHDSLQILSQASITDKPYFPYRGLMVDTSRNFLSVKALKEIIDGMAYNKLNTLHWHITDSQSFPFYSKRVPQMTTYGAYSPRHVYYETDIREIIRYANYRGIRVMPEIDIPSHAGNGWQWGEKQGKGRLALCLNQQSWKHYCFEPPCGQLNPVNPNVFITLEEIYRDLLDIFESDLFHFGGDEVNMNCWENSKEINDFLKSSGIGMNETTFLNLWGEFMLNAHEKFSKAKGSKDITNIIWSSKLTENDIIKNFFNKDNFIIQVWSKANDPMIENLLKNGYRIIISNHDAWYLDCGFEDWTKNGLNWCSPFKTWMKMYDNSPEEIVEAFNITLQRLDSVIRGPRSLPLVLGGEVAMWGEQADGSSIHTKIWPRASAVAERLWSNPSTKWESAEGRMINHRERMVRRGILASSISPYWCYQNEGECNLN